MRLRRLIIPLLIAVAVAGCAHAPAPPPDVVAAPGIDAIVYGRGQLRTAPAGPTTASGPGTVAVLQPAAVLPPPGGQEPYTLDSGDKLRIVVFGQEGLTNSYIVDAAGRVTMPLIGSVPARGMTTVGLARSIADKLRGGFIREPHVAIEVETYRPFFILGEITAPGQYAFVPNMTVETAIAIAGGFTPRAFRYNAEISRSGGGVTARRSVPLIAPVRPGDTITVQERWF